MLYRAAIASLIAIVGVHTTAQAAPVADYSVQFDSSFNAAANTQLTLVNADVQADGLHTNEALWGTSSVSLANVLSTGSEYTISLDFAYVGRTDSSRKILDFFGRSSEAGFYLNSGGFVFYDGLGHPQAESFASVLSPYEAFNVTVSRTSAGIFTAYFNGVEQLQFEDSAGLAVFNSPGFAAYILTDEVDGYEITNGALTGISVYKTALSTSDLGGGISPVPEPESYALALAGLLTVGSLMKRRRA
ncbi:PEP-CTERM sorting domain-containing protein [Aquabacterium sp.]|uniref:PEP-CTERM sorting domain-containing protein n=1 Tax=Aquabacterium sp. TaxID=1872578 RepID=UPI003D6CEAF1